MPGKGKVRGNSSGDVQILRQMSVQELKTNRTITSRWFDWSSVPVRTFDEGFACQYSNLPLFRHLLHVTDNDDDATLRL